MEFVLHVMCLHFSTQRWVCYNGTLVGIFVGLCIEVSHSVKQGGLNFRNPVMSAARLHQVSSEACEMLVKSLMEGDSLNSVEHKQCNYQAGATAGNERIEEEKA